ncbi:SDR family NAD(P)-dependent oxidoreductase [Aspergillus lucknowensis]|uniref:Oxidoreductase n=1 Tax=Aspergillus lucknowensis TaxID=176173 RepID=A0ABR4LN74_9EURO
MSLYLNGVALVTGAGSGIGRECALGYAAEGARGIVLADPDYDAAVDAAQEAETLATHPAFTAVAMRVDVTDLGSVAEMIRAVMKVFGRVDYYVHIATALNHSSVGGREEVERENPDRAAQMGANGAMQCVRAVSRVMKNQSVGRYKSRGRIREGSRGTIITVASRNPTTTEHTQGATENPLLDLTRKAALKNAAHGVRVNAICPGLVENADPVSNGSIDPQKESIVPMSRTARPEEIADVALFLSSPRASYVTGATWTVDGGLALHAMQTQTANRAAVAI